jgi:hypothetical protein
MPARAVAQPERGMSLRCDPLLSSLQDTSTVIMFMWELFLGLLDFLAFLMAFT